MSAIRIQFFDAAIALVTKSIFESIKDKKIINAEDLKSTIAANLKIGVSEVMKLGLGGIELEMLKQESIITDTKSSLGARQHAMSKKKSLALEKNQMNRVLTAIESSDKFLSALRWVKDKYGSDAQKELIQYLKPIEDKYRFKKG